MADDQDLLLVFTGSAIEAGFVKDHLESNDIVPLLKDEMHDSISSGRATPDDESAVKLFVPGNEYKEAIKLVQEFSNARNDTGPDPSGDDLTTEDRPM